MLLFFKSEKNVTIPAYEFLLHNCRNNIKKKKYFKTKKKLQV